MRVLSSAVVLALLFSSTLAAQVRVPHEGGTIRSLGQPASWKWSAGGGAGRVFGEPEHHGAVEAKVGVYRDLVNPVLGLAGVQAEVYAGRRNARLDGGARAQLVSPFARLAIGADHNVADDRTDLLLSYLHPGRRGGLFRDGSMLRLNYLPARDHTLMLGIEWPILRRAPMGRTRPRRDHVRLSRPELQPIPLPEAAHGIDLALEGVRDAAGWIRRLTVPFLDQDGRGRQAAERAFLTELHELQQALAGTVSDGIRRGRSVEAEVGRYHAQLERAFSIAVAGHELPEGQSTAIGRAVAEGARSILLSEVLLPYNRLLGQVKKKDSVRQFGRGAQGAFLRWIHTESAVPPERSDAVQWAFAELLDIVEANRAAARAQWRDSRFVWLPLQYALRPEQHDTQAKLDTLIEQAVGEEFTEGNFVSYVINEQFQYQLSRTVRQAEDYHVLWTHDFRGFAGDGRPDEMSYRQVLRSYLAAMTERVRAYDRTGTFPVYIILLDEWFYQVNRGRLWMNLLEDPTGHRLRLPAGYEDWEDSIAAAQEALRTAIAESALLQAQKRQYGERWLRNLIKVHVNITNSADPSFWSTGVIRFLPVPDNMMRDHRKVVFYDITEDDPYRGEAIYTGAGVGEHYASLSWEDRSLLVRGPAALGLKNAARSALLQQGLREHEIPHPLQPRPKARDYDDRIRLTAQQDQRPLRALEIHNGTGFDSKQVNVAKAVLYTLMPPGSVIKIPDSLWNSPFWGATLLGCAMRGVRVLIIAPAVANAPAAVFPSMSRKQELLWRLVTAERALASEMAAGGLLKVGVYAPDFEVTDIPAKVRSVQLAFAEHAWLRDLFGFAPSAYEDVAELADALAGLAMAPIQVSEFDYDPLPKLHLKANFFASREAWTLMSRPEWSDLSWEFVQQRIAQVQSRAAAIGSFEDFPEAFIDVGDGMVRDWVQGLDPAARERVVFYSLMGSQNQNERSMVVDAEVAFLISNWPSIIPYLDLISLVGQSRWIEDPSELDALVPAQPEWRRRLARWTRIAF